MSVESMALVLHHSRAKGTAKLILLGIANHDGDGGAWPTVATLAKYAGGVDERTVRRALGELEDLGEVVVHANQGGNHRTPGHLRPNLYEVRVACPPECDRTKEHRARHRGDASVPPVENRSNGRSEGGRQRPRGEDASVRGGGTPVSGEPSMNHPVNPGEGTSHSTSPAPVEKSSPLEDLGGGIGSEPGPLARPDRCARHQTADIVPPCGWCREARLAVERRKEEALMLVHEQNAAFERAVRCPEHAGGRVGYCSGCEADHKAGAHADEHVNHCPRCVAEEVAS